MHVPPNLREFQVDLAGRLVTLDQPGPEVKALRERYGFTQEWLAGVLRMRRESLSRVESGHVSLSLPFVQRFTKVMTLARGVREHMAFVEARGNAPDDAYLARLAVALRIEKAAADEVTLASQINYAQKRRNALRSLTR